MRLQFCQSLRQKNREVVGLVCATSFQRFGIGGGGSLLQRVEAQRLGFVSRLKENLREDSQIARAVRETRTVIWS